MDRRIYWVWLQQSLPLGSTVLNRLFEHFEDIEAVYAADAKQLKALPLRPDDVKNLSNKSLTRARRILKDVQDLGGAVMTPDDARYPDALRHIAGFPAVLYVQGDFPNVNALPTIGVVSTRDISEEGEKLTFGMAAGLAAAGMIVVSGGAKGGDAAAHNGAMYADGKTVLVKAAPLDVEYPLVNKQLRQDILNGRGAIVTEFEPASQGYRDYHVRNRLISGMSVGVCITEAPKRSGTIITANLAREQGREVFAVPGSVLDGRHDGAHDQLRQGAILVSSAVNIVDEYLPRFPGLLDRDAAIQAETAIRKRIFKKAVVEEREPRVAVADKKPETMQTTVTCPEEASAEAKRLFTFLSATPCPVDTLAKNAALSSRDVLILLTELELFGCVENTAGQQYKLVTQ